MFKKATISLQNTDAEQNQQTKGEQSKTSKGFLIAHFKRYLI
jgi:hypothetical protein